MEGTSIKLVIYVDPKLLEQDPSTGSPNLGNLTLARKVGGVANTVFQSKSPDDFSEANDFGWKQAYQIGAYKQLPAAGAMVGAGASKKPIAPNSMCDWTGINNKPLQYMPEAVQADKGWFDKFPADQGMFGTKGQPRDWINAIWCSTGGTKPSDFMPIYTDVTKPPAGLPYRGYQVSNEYQVSWEVQSFAPGVFASTWSEPWPFRMGPNDTNKFISWGYNPNQKKVSWYDYGTKDPGKHDPSLAVVGGSTALMSLGDDDVLGLGDAFSRRPLSFRFDWTDVMLSYEARRTYAAKLFQYIKQSAGGYLDFHNAYIGTYLSTAINLKASTSFGDVLPGDTESQKVIYYLRGLISNISPTFAPDKLDWKYENGQCAELPCYIEHNDRTLTTDQRNFVNLVWRNLPRPNVENLTAASASAKLFADKLRENLKETEFELESVTQSTKDQTMASTRIYFKNITDPKQYAEIIALMQKTASAEKARTTPIANNSAVPTPDDVEVKGDDAVMGLIESDNEMVNGQNGMTNGTGLVPPA